MINKIQELISELNARKSEAEEMAEINYKCGHYGIGGLYKERLKAYDFCIQELTLLLNSGSENSGKKDGGS